MDEKYISEGIGGSYHRHFDGTHTLWGSRKATDLVIVSSIVFSSL
jgi:hypothetical protein